MIYSARSLSPEQKMTIEALIGHPLSDQDCVSVQRLTPPHLSAERRKEVLEGLQRHFAQVDAQRSPMSEEEALEAVNAAMRSVKPSYNPIL